MDNNDYVIIRRYCAIESRFCERELKREPFPSAFLAYPSGPRWSQFYAELALELNGRGIAAHSWEDVVTGGVIFPKVCEAIHSSSFVLSELTTLNANVLFETGYALAVGRDVIILRDNSLKSSDLPLLKTKESCHYNTRQDIHTFLQGYVAHVSSHGSNAYDPAVLQMNDIAEAQEYTGTLYYLRPRISTQIVNAIQGQLEHSLFKVTRSDPADTTFDDFYHQARQIKESQVIVGVLVNKNTRNAQWQNAPVALLLGFAVGLGKRVLVLQERPNDPIVDVGTVLHEFEGERSAKSFAEGWVKQQSSVLFQAERQQLIARKRAEDASRVRNVFLGQPDAMVDYHLMSYFLDTPQYRQARNDVKQMFVGRKGAGKSAIFRALESELHDRTTGILVAISPTDFQFERLTGLAVDRYSILHPAFVFQTFWRFILITEVLRTIANRYAHFIQSSDEAHVGRILKFIHDEEGLLEEDFASRALAKLDALQAIPTNQSNVATQNALEAVLQRVRMNQIEKDLQRLARNYPIHVLIDDIDKYWNPSYEASVHLLLGLVNETTQMHSRFKGAARVSLFLRQDIFDVLRRRDVELVKRNIATLRWEDEQLLQLIAERIRYARDMDQAQDDEVVWTSIFPATIQEQASWRYMVGLTLKRPRDLLQFCQVAIEKAQVRRHNTVSEDDVLAAEKDYSNYMFDALRLEYLPIYPDLENVLFEFGHWRVESNLDETTEFIASQVLNNPDFSKPEWVQSCDNDALKLLEILFEVGFVGLRDTTRGIDFYSIEHDFTEAKRLVGKNPMVVIHPAFHKALYL